MPKIALLHRIRPPQMAAGGIIDWIGPRTANAGICVQSERQRSKLPNERQKLWGSQHFQYLLKRDQVTVRTIELHFCLPLTPHRSAQLCKT
jgi:hypothetical protein